MTAGLIRPVNIDDQMREAYLDYAMSVIVARALPDARDGLKPVHRRILYAMYDMGLRPDAAYRKSARIVGEVLGKYHPHGDVAVYEAMARMAQDFSMRYELVDGQGNFGSIDGDAPAAMRYTEARMQSMAADLLADIDKNTTDFGDNFDGSMQEPLVLPAAIPNLLINGSSGIAVGMSTNIPPHNLGEVVDACIYMLRNWDHLEDVDVLHLMEYIKGPDFPTGGLCFRQDAKTNEDAMITAYATGRSKLIVRAKAHIEDLGRGKTRIIISEIPYAINKSSLMERIADLVRDEKIDGISDLRDESDRQGLRIVIECKTNADPADVLNVLFKYTPLQSTFGVIMLALVDGEPRTLTLKQALRVYLDHRIEVVRRRSEYDLAHARARAHILEGLLIALNDLDRVINTIRLSQTTEIARATLMERFELTEAQATAILDLQLRRLASLEREKIQSEYDEKLKLIAYLEHLLSNAVALRSVIIEELKAVKTQYNDPRRTLIVNSAARAVTADDLLAHNESTWVTLTFGYRLSRTYQDAPPKLTAQTQDPPRFLLRSNTADVLYLIAADGHAASIPVQQLPLADDPAIGAEVRAISDLRNNEPIVGAFSFLPSQADGFLAFASQAGDVKRIRVADLPGLVAKSFTVMNVGDDKLVSAKYVEEEDEMILITAEAQAIRFNVADVRPTGLPAGGMRGIKLSKSDMVVTAMLSKEGDNVWVISEQGVAKSTPLAEYPIQGRAGAGVITAKLNLGDRLAAGAMVATLDDPVVILTYRGKFKFVKARTAPHGSRASKGDLVGVNLVKSDKVVSITQIVQRPAPPAAEAAPAAPSSNGAHESK
ncbi:MAG: DNA topoisomerase (ATP-hydrolyzing) subunit A [Anaerolineae bacterium]|nr:DNA topoisomerase (ATP-hydrolyzing) subunit A [Anaerolineae bacterium]